MELNNTKDKMKNWLKEFIEAHKKNVFPMGAHASRKRWEAKETVNVWVKVTIVVFNL